MNGPTRVALCCLLLALVLRADAVHAQPSPLAWPATGQETKPWTRWWWMGNAVTPEELTAAMEAYKRAGLGGLEITPIYGVAGYEDRFIEYLSPQWVAALQHVLREADRLGLGIDMATGTGWPFGGPTVGPDDAARYVAHQTYRLQGGDRLREPVTYRQEPFVRAVGNQIYEIYGSILRADGETPEGTRERPLLRRSADPIEIDDLVEPIAANEDLQALALDQVRFDKALPLQVLMAYADDGRVLDLTGHVDGEGLLNWTAPEGSWTLYAVFQGWHGKMVERAAPGGEGYVIDHFSEEALNHYLQRFDEAFAGGAERGVRAFFNDSYEVDDARGEADWTPDFFDAFSARRGYDLRSHLPALFGDDTDDDNRRVLSDYRQTISDLLLDAFTVPWRAWAHGRGALVRNQAHGSPGNILDLYAASDVPETEGTDLLRIKFASSAAHVTGKTLTAAESATWLNEHFTSSLADVKEALDRFFLGGVNHVFYHGTNYSPQGEAWPGWLFYAAVHFSPSNPFWDDFGALNTYAARVQSFLQSGTPANDVLLYFPIFDRYAERGNALLRHFDGVEEAFSETAFNRDAALLLERGYAYDLISDRQLQDIESVDGTLRTGGVSYRAVIVPGVEWMPLETLERLIEAAQAGATVLIHGALPRDVPGLGNLEARRAAFQKLLGDPTFSDAGAGIEEATLGDGRLVTGEALEPLLSYAGIRREALTDTGLQFVRRRQEKGTTYFVVNQSGTPMDEWVPFQAAASSVALFDPASGTYGIAPSRPSEAGATDVYLRLDPGASRIVQTYDAAVAGDPYPVYDAAGRAEALAGPWSVRFLKGGPALPGSGEMDTLASWTALGEAAEMFSGTAAYTRAFPRPTGRADAWLLDLGTVHESARVRLNGQVLDTLLGPTYRLSLDSALLLDSNVLEVEVTNLMANRIADLDRRQVPWKKFYNVNFPARLRENRDERGLFDASQWTPRPSGLLGPVTLTPLVRRTF